MSHPHRVGSQAPSRHAPPSTQLQHLGGSERGLEPFVAGRCERPALPKPPQLATHDPLTDRNMAQTVKRNLKATRCSRRRRLLWAARRCSTSLKEHSDETTREQRKSPSHPTPCQTLRVCQISRVFGTFSPSFQVLEGHLVHLPTVDLQRHLGPETLLKL